jgi:hypothetical protein
MIYLGSGMNGNIMSAFLACCRVDSPFAYTANCDSVVDKFLYRVIDKR